MVKNNPVKLLIILLGCSILIFGYLFRIFEAKYSDASGQDYSKLMNCMWNVIITITSVGYGDIYPKSVLGRTVAVMCCFWGTFIISFFVVAVNSVLTLSDAEEKASELLIRLYMKNELKRDAVGVLSEAFRHKNVKN